MTIEIAFRDHHLTTFAIGLEAVTLGIVPLKIIVPAQLEIVAADGSATEMIDCLARRGNLRALWTLIDATVVRIEMDAASFRLHFEDGTIIRRRRDRNADLILVQDGYSRDLMRYPECLDDPDGRGIKAVTDELIESRRNWGRTQR